MSGGRVVLLPCPFCGGETATGILQWSYVFCQCCGVSKSSDDPNEDAQVLWDTRTPNPPAAASEVVRERREQAMRAFLAEMDRQCSIGAGMAQTDIETGLLVVHADIDPFGMADAWVAFAHRLASLSPAQPKVDHRDQQIETLRRALAWHGDPQRMATTREKWQQEIDDAIVWVKANPEPDRLSFSSLATPTATHNAEALREALEATSVHLAMAATQFAFYAEEHSKKDTADGDTKAATNRLWALACLESHDNARSVMNGEQWFWWAGDNDEEYRLAGPCRTRELAISEAYAETDTGKTIYLIEAVSDEHEPGEDIHPFLKTRNASQVIREEDAAPTGTHNAVPPQKMRGPTADELEAACKAPWCGEQPIEQHAKIWRGRQWVPLDAAISELQFWQRRDYENARALAARSVLDSAEVKS